MTLNKILWSIWWFATTVVILGSTALYISLHHTDIQITLEEGETTHFEVFRVLPDSVSLQLHFTRDKRPWPELGNWEKKVKTSKVATSIKQENYKYKIDFTDVKFKNTIQTPPKFPEPSDWKNPGEPIEILFSYKEQSVLYYAWPNTYSSPTRILVPLNRNHLNLGIGYNNISIHIQKVGKLISGEKVTLRVKGPVDIKSSCGNHFILVYFFFAPIYATVLLILLVILLVKKRKKT